MKKIIKTGLSTLALLLCFANCGKSGGGNNTSTAYTDPNQVYAQCGGDQACIQRLLGNTYGNYNSYLGQGYCGGNPCHQWQVPQPCGGCHSGYQYRPMYSNQNAVWFGVQAGGYYR